MITNGCIPVAVRASLVNVACDTLGGGASMKARTLSRTWAGLAGLIDRRFGCHTFPTAFGIALLVGIRAFSRRNSRALADAEGSLGGRDLYNWLLHLSGGTSTRMERSLR